MKLNRTLSILAMGAFLMSAAPVHADKPEKAKTEKTRCQATTQEGTRCKLKAIEGTKYCAVHKNKHNNGPRCKATTQKGTRCKRPAVKQGYCTQHLKQQKKK